MPRLLKRPTRIATIGLVPLIDVVFILLLFFMLATNFEQTGSVSLAASHASTAAIPTPAQWISLRISAGAIELEGEEVSVDQVGAMVQARLTTLTGAKVLVFCEDDVPVQRLVSVMDRLHASDVSDASFSVQQGNK